MSQSIENKQDNVIQVTPYKRLFWANNSEPAISADNLNHIEEALDQLLGNKQASSTQPTSLIQQMINTIAENHNVIDDNESKIETLANTTPNVNDIIPTIFDCGSASEYIDSKEG